MSPTILLIVTGLYFTILLLVAYVTSKGSDNNSYFIGNRNSNWKLVAFGMVGTTLSGVTFVSVPGNVGLHAFKYMQITIGYFLGYIIIAYLLLPIYYKMHLTSIYTYLEKRLGFISYKTGASFFIISRTLGATARLYLVVNILQSSILSAIGVPFWLTTSVIMLMILLYTFNGGVKTIVWTDSLQTMCMLGGLIICSLFIINKLGISPLQAMHNMNEAGYTDIFVTDTNSKIFFVKQILAGAFITIAMTGLDQEMMQKNISVRTLKNSQKNMILLAFIMIIVIAIFLFLGGLLHLYASHIGVNVKGDSLFPLLAINYMSPTITIIFIIALISALFPSADGAITALTSSFCIDILGINRKKEKSEKWRSKVRKMVHLSFAAIFIILVMIFKYINSNSMIDVILAIASYTYGPLLGLFAFGIFTKRKVNEKFVPAICLIAPVICFLTTKYQHIILGNFQLGLEILILNGCIVYLALMLVSYKKHI